jgi:transglutaminase-like putative cysteine protease
MSKASPAKGGAHPSQTTAATALVTLAYLPLAVQMATVVSAYIGLLVVWRLASLRWPNTLARRWSMLPLTIGGVATVFGAYHTLLGPEGGTALLATMLTLKLLEIHRPRDVRAVTVLLGFLLVSQFLFDQSAWLALYLCAVLIANFALMIDLTASEQRRSSMRRSVALASRLSLQAIPLTLVLFVLFPRLTAPLWDLSLSRDRARTGMTSTLEPGAISELVLSGELAFRARFDGPIPAADKLYWRGPTAWTTDGRRWTGLPSLPSAPTLPPLAASGNLVAYQITLEPTSQRTLFVLDMPVEVPPHTRVSAAFEVHAAREVREPRRYRAVSALTYNTGEIRHEQRAAGLRTPPNVTPRMRRLVAEWKRQAASPQEVVRAALRYFNHEPFYYTLKPPKLGANPDDEFLFETRRGFCEHYASGFALLMRIAGIPSRIVLGYLGGELNPLGDYLIVRQSDAHAWVEVWLDGRGWVRVDPTAAVAPTRVEPSEILAGLAAGAPARFQIGDPGPVGRWAHRFRLLADAIDAGWRSWVLEYSSARQQRLLDAVGLGVLREYGLALAMVVASAVVLSLIAAGMGRGRAPHDPLEKLYARFCRRLAARGLVRRPSEGPMMLCERAASTWPDLRTPIASFMSLYLLLRYGREAHDANNLRELRQRLGRVTEAMRGAARTRPTVEKAP